MVQTITNPTIKIANKTNKTAKLNPPPKRKITTKEQRLKHGIPDYVKKSIFFLVDKGYAMNELEEIFLVDPQQLRSEVMAYLAGGK